MERVGLTKIKAAIIDDEKQRKELYERFKESQKFAQVDPWKAIADGERTEEFTPIRITG